ISGAHEWNAMRPELQPVLQRPDAVFVQRFCLFAHVGQIEILLLFRFQDRRVQEWHLLLKDGCVACDAEIMAGDEWQEVKVVRYSSANSASSRGMPPVLH